MLRICFAIFTLEIGIFLVMFPWMDTWNSNYFHNIGPAFRDIWDSSFFRGAVTGLGLIDVYLACSEVAHLLKRV